MPSMRNIYIIRSRISAKKFREILRLFCLDLSAKQTSEISKISHLSILKIYDKIRVRISEYCEENSVFETGEIELAESYFGGKKRSWCFW
jgi:transposase